MAGHMELEVSFIKLIDQVLVYHRETCIDMHIQPSHDTRLKMYNKAEAARELIMLLGNQVLTKNEFKIFQSAIQQKLEAVYQAVFFDPATRKLIKKTKEQCNGG